KLSEKTVRGQVFVFSEKKVTVSQKGTDDREYPVQIDPTKSPKEIDLYVPWAMLARAHHKGIYHLGKDRLKISWVQDFTGARPKELTGKKGYYLAVLRRAKDKGDKNEKELAQVKGTATFEGQPLANATVEFVPVKKGGQKATGTTNQKGEYQLTTLGKKGAL